MYKTVKLTKRAIVRIEPIKPFNFEGTFFKPSHFSSKLVIYDNNKLYQAIEIDNNFLGIKISDDSKKITSRIKVAIYARTNVSERLKQAIKKEIITRYNLDGKIEDFIDMFKKDKLLAGPIKRWGGMRPSSAYSLYGFFMVATVLQNATIKRTIQMMDNLLNKFSTKLIFEGREVYSIWKPEDIENVTEKKLRKLKIGYRAKNIKRISHSFATKEISEKKLRDINNKIEIKKVLLGIYGVGPQSVSYLLFEAFHFYDALDHLSPWEGKIISMLLYGDKTVDLKHILSDVEKRWGKWKMLAIHYIFEDLFWRRKKEKIPWLEEEIRM